MLVLDRNRQKMGCRNMAAGQRASVIPVSRLPVNTRAGKLCNICDLSVCSQGTDTNHRVSARDGRPEGERRQVPNLSGSA